MKETPLHKKLANTLVSLIPSLDEEGLSFLVEQANVHLYNMEIVKQESLPSKIAKTAGAGNASGSGTKKSAKAIPANFRVERSPSGSSYHLISGGKWKMFNEQEMLSIVRIAQVKESLLEVAGRLHAWFEEERPDVFADMELGDRFDPKLKELVSFLRKKFNVKKNK